MVPCISMRSTNNKLSAILIDNDSLYNIALNGDDLNMGMLDVIEEFSEIYPRFS